MKSFLYLLIFYFLFNNNVQASEESLNLDDVKTPPPESSSGASSSGNKFALMGRVDLTSETSSPSGGNEKNHNLENNHFFIFLKVKASEQTSFLGEIANKSFFAIHYAPVGLPLEVEFGKIIVPFGDTRHFHHFYGGLQGYKATGVMLPNLWAESGANLKWTLGQNQLETYWVDSIRDDSTSQDPSLQSSAEPRNIQAIGSRWSMDLGSKIHSLISIYRGEYQSGKAVELAGLDLYSDYGAWDLNHWRWSLGIANAWLRKAPLSGDFQKRGDYLELSTNYIGSGEARFRYGTYIDNDKKVSQKDTHSFNLGYLLPVDALRVLTEYQWNYEAVNEVSNDLFRIMVSLDF